MRSCFEMKKCFKTAAGDRFGSDLEKTGLKTVEVLQNAFCHFWGHFWGRKLQYFTRPSVESRFFKKCRFFDLGHFRVVKLRK